MDTQELPYLYKELVNHVLVDDCYPHLYAVSKYYYDIWRVIISKYMEYREPITNCNYRDNVMISSHKKCKHIYDGVPNIIFGTLWFNRKDGYGNSGFDSWSFIISRAGQTTAQLSINQNRYSGDISLRDILTNYHCAYWSKKISCNDPECFEYIYYHNQFICKLDWNRVRCIGKLRFKTYIKLLAHMTRELPMYNGKPLIYYQPEINAFPNL
jgi:hypothetical protein